MEYAQFISSVKALREEATQLFGRERLHEDPHFRKWRHELTDLIARISHQGFPVNCQISARIFDQNGSPDTSRSKKDRVAAYDRDLLDTINELDTLIKRYGEFGVPLVASDKAGNEFASTMSTSNFVSRFREHWFVSLVVLSAAVASATWVIEYQLFVVPRDFEIVRLNEALAHAQSQANATGTPAVATRASEGKVLLSYVGVAVGNSITTPDGTCTVRIIRLDGESASLEVTIDAEEPQSIKQAEIGRRIVVRRGSLSYYIDLHRQRGSMVDLSVSRSQPAELPPESR